MLRYFNNVLIIAALAGSATSYTPSHHVHRRTAPKTTTARHYVDYDVDTMQIDQALFDEEKKLLPPLAPEDAWISNLDFDAFRKDINALGKELEKETGDEDLNHFNKIESWRNIAALVGLGTVWMDPNLFTIAALSTWTYTSWTIFGHHVGHGSYNKLSPDRFHSRKFGIGLVNRFVDWLDWIQAETWNHEHNGLHHYRLNEEKDPHVVERNLSWLRDGDYPLFLKYTMVTLFMMNWKWFYYAPNAYKELKIHEWKKSGEELPDGLDPHEQCTLYHLFDPKQKPLQEVVKPAEVFSNVIAPMFLGRYALPPALLYAVPDVGPSLAAHAVVNLLLAELLTNAHSFITMVTNHAGEDMYHFDGSVKPKSGSFYVRQIVGSVNYSNGNDVLDFFHGWLNYHAEHHVWPHLSMLQYQRGAPKLKALCEKHGVPYLQGNIIERTKKTIDIMVGKKSTRRFPSEYEPAKDKANPLY